MCIMCKRIKRHISSSVPQERFSIKTEIKFAFSFEFVALSVGK